MLIYEILQRKNYIEQKIKDIDCYLNKIANLNLDDKASLYNRAIELKYALLNKLRSHISLLREQNKENTVSIGTDIITVEEALYLRKTISTKIQTLDKIISEGDLQVISVFGLIEQRDKLFEEFMLLDTAIQESDLTSSWEN